MSYTAPAYGAYSPGLPHMLSTNDPSIGPMLTTFNFAAGTYPTQYLAIYVPVRVRQPCIVRQLGLFVATASGNVDIGLYNMAGTRIVSTGSTAAAANMVVNTTDVTLASDIYYLACCADNTTVTVARYAPAAPVCAALGVLSETLGSVVLPATASWAVGQTLAYVPCISAVLDTVSA